jgi:hypothetical protein
MPDIDHVSHDVEVVAFPLSPLRLAQVTLAIAKPLLVVPEISIGLEFVVNVEVEVGEVMAIIGVVMLARQATVMLVMLAELIVPDPFVTEQVWPAG